ncbi:MAG TPA: tRNA (adenosine(37)-N6)-dimethylallyltransferase MiaA [Myxococcota bacterium]
MSAPAPARPPVVVVTGPTSAGKTALAIELAEKFDGEIVNADSMQVYRYMDIGTAKPTPEQRARVPHHLIDVVTPDVPFNAGRYVVEARRAATAIHARRKIVVLAGGTGLYIRAFLEGLLAAGAADPELRERLEREDAQARAEGHPQRLHAKLEAVDPEAAARIHVNDARRIIRALEIVQHTGQPSAWLRDAQRCADRPFRALQLALDPGRETLDRRIDAACARMLEAGLLREVRGLCERRYGPELAPMQAIGYRHLLPVVQGADTLRNALAAMQRDTRRFARRQRTWLRGVPETRWFDPAARDAIFATVEEFLRGAEAPALHSV